MLLNKAKTLNSLPILPILSIFLVGFILVSPALLNGSLNGYDFPWHLRWSQHFSSQFWLGDLYPRWLRGMNAGLGSPTFFYYPPIPYYFTSLFQPLFPNDAQGWYPLILSTLFALVASGWTAYLWLKTITDQKSALIASMIYMALPYHLAVDLYARFAFAEYWSFVWIPLIFYFSHKLINSDHSNIIGFAISYALLCMTHLPTLVICSIFPLLYVLFVAPREQKKKALFRIIISMVLGIGLSAIFWVPALTTQNYVSLDSINQGKFSYAINFLFMEQASEQNTRFWRYLEVMFLLMGALGGSAFLATRHNSQATLRRESNYWITVTMIAVFMSLPLSKAIWDVLPILQKVQFPWRFGVVLTVAVTPLLALAISSVNSSINLGEKKVLSLGFVLLIVPFLAILQMLTRMTASYFVSILIVVAVVLLSIIASHLKIPLNRFNKKSIVVGILLVTSLILASILPMRGGLYKGSSIITPYSITKQLEKEISKDTEEYRLRDVSPTIYKASVLSQLAKSYPDASVTTGQGSVTIEQWKPREIILSTNGKTELGLTLKHFYYPQWAASVKGESRSLTVQPSNPEGLILIGVIPSGRHEVIVTLKAGRQERIGQLMSAIFAIIVLALWFWFYRSERDRVNPNAIHPES